MRYKIGSSIELEKENRELKEKLNEIEKKKERKKESGYNRAQLREELLFNFSKKTGLNLNNDIFKYMRKILNSPKTKNISTAAYKSELDQIQEAIPVLGIERITEIIHDNATKCYFHLIYESQLNKNGKYNRQYAKNKTQIVENKTNTYGECRKLSDFNDYRIYLNNPENDDELAKFVLDSFGIVARKNG